MRKQNIIATAVVVVALCAAAAAGLAPDAGIIKAPTFSQPAFTLEDGGVDVSVAAPGEAALAGISLYDPETGGPVAGVEVDMPLEKGLNDTSFDVPDGVGPGMYDLCVTVRAAEEIEACQPHAVVVVESFEPPFRFVQITDFHVGDPRAEKQFPGMDIRRVRLEAIKKANELEPAFVLMTGDITAYPETYGDDYPAAVEEIVDNIDVPSLIIPGNHDHYTYMADDYDGVVEGLDFWEKYFGPEHRVLDYGPVRFIMFNTYGWDPVTRNRNRPWHLNRNSSHTYQGTLTQDEYRWVIKALKTTGGRMPVLVAHHGPRTFEVMPQQWCDDCISQMKFTSLMKKAKVPYYIYGHIHRNEEYTEGPTHYIATTSVGSDVGAKDLWGIREFTVGEDLKIESRVIRLFDEPPMK